MKPIAIFRHSPTEGPGHFDTVLRRRKLASQLIRVDAGDPLPASSKAYAGIVLMGGPMSVNDELPWIPGVLGLVREAIAADVPVLGHCLGGQLIAKALGAEVHSSAAREIGWGAVTVLDNPAAKHWFGETRTFDSFHWHGETFAIPDGATRILESAYCPNQAYALGKHLGLQCHVEMTPELIASWCETGADEIAKHPAPSVQDPATMQADIASRLTALHEVADRLYDRWFEGLRYQGVLSRG